MLAAYYMDPSHPFRFARTGREVRNRGLLAAMTNKQSYEDGRLSDDETSWLVRRAKDGFGIITTAASHVSETGKGWSGEMGVWSDDHLDGLTTLATRLREHGALSLVQLFHGGMKAPIEINGLLPVCPSEMTDEQGEVVARALDEDDILELISHFTTAAVRCQQAGFDGIELHGAHGYLISQFLGTITNRRTDQWGGDVASRMKFLTMIIDSIRDATDEHFLIGVRFSPIIRSIGITIEDSIEVVQRLSQMDIDMLHISCWDVFEQQPDGRHVTAIFRAHVPPSIAYISTGAVWTSKDAQWLMGQGADLVGVARVAIAHPDWANHLADESYSPQRPPFSPEELSDADLSPVFIDYMRNWDGFVSS